MTLSYNDGCIITDQIKIQRGSFKEINSHLCYLAWLSCAFTIRVGYIWVWLQDQKHKCSNQQSVFVWMI